MTTEPTSDHLRDLVLLRRVRDRIDRDHAQPLDVEALARGVHMSADHLSRQFKLAYGESPYSYSMTRRIERAMTLLRRITISSSFLPDTDPAASLAFDRDVLGFEVRLDAAFAARAGRRRRHRPGADPAGRRGP